jgi:hypothetical protein
MNAKPIYSNSFKKFLSESDSRICSILHRLDLKDRPSSILTTKDINYLTNRKEGLISYLPSNRPHIMNEDYTWSRQGRESGRAGRVIRKLFDSRFISRYLTDKDFEDFTNLYRSEFNDHGLQFILHDCDAIGNVYNMDRYENGGTLDNSCMNGDGDYMEMYVSNRSMQILALVNDRGELCGRALVWHNVIVNGNPSRTITFMDRVYVSDDFMFEMFVRYAIDKKWYYKVNYKNGGAIQQFVNPDGDKEDLVLRVNLDTEFDSYPYIDTLCYGGDGWLSNDNSDSIYTYQNTGGDREETNRQWDELNQESIDDDDARYIDHGRYIGHYIHYENAVDVNGDWWWIDDEDIVEVDGTWYEKSDDDVVEVDGTWYRTDDDYIAYCECDSEYHHVDDLVYHDSKGWILLENAVKVKDVIYHKDEVEELV